MIILGLDPGSRRIGYGVLDATRSRVRLLEAGLLPIKSEDDAGALKEAKRGFEKLLKKFRPAILAIEKIFFMKNQKTGLEVAQVRGVLLLAALERGILVKEYSPNEIKAGVTSYGLADKKAIEKMVKLILQEPHLAVIDDAIDALAVALLASQKAVLNAARPIQNKRRPPQD